ncbi:CaiB/BaiF CoA transferase family protein [Congregibacter litoralis]|uniref:Putative acyl-CoA transferase/carnitine dehydratase n=1 Tax=Congregibacter litoralis KT71 TaxID=314285 RepID=A4A3Z6_9GAMM|nr:CaiB/BaiF CoA-transferase family protein [Congregibacter litoralis]EAQ99419.1 putative acyl-CoA transferase/carnitine dehydratase [Congregibacter litoralis KT71]
MGPLNGYTVIELAGIGPAPMGGMMLADQGAEVIRVDRAAADAPSPLESVSGRGKKSVVLNLKSPEGIEALLRMVENADVLIDPFRPGVCEKLGIGPEVCLKRNPKLVFARMTGWGQDGPLAKAAGHDINYIALTGALFANGEGAGRPMPPLNLVGDMGGGGMLLVNGVLAALLETASSGQGQVIDIAMVDGAAQLMWMFHSFYGAGLWNADQREANMLDGGTHFYNTYECADGEYVSIGSIEPQFYALLMEKAGLSEADFGEQNNPARWPEQKKALASVMRQKTRDEWCELMEGSDVCFAPVLRFTEATTHKAAVARDSYIELDGVVQPAPAPRFSRTAATVAHGARANGADTESVLGAMGFGEQEIASLREAGAIN